MANRKDIELAIKGVDLASKPLTAIGTAVDKLVDDLDKLTPAAAKGEVGMAELAAIAGKLKQALTGLGASRALTENFDELSQKTKAAQEAQAGLVDRLEKARAAMAATVKPTKEVRAELTAAQKAFDTNQRSIARWTEQLAAMSARASTAGLDLNHLAGAQSQIDTVFKKTAVAYERVNGLLDGYATRQRESRTAAQQAAEGRAQAERVSAAATVAAEKTREQAMRKTAAVQKQLQDEATAREAAFLREQQARAKAQSALTNFRQTGTNAIASASSVSEKPVSVDKLAVSQSQAGASVRALIDPTGELAKDIGGLESLLTSATASLDKYNAELRDTGKSTVNVVEASKQLRTVQEGAAAIAVVAERFQAVNRAAAEALVELRAAKAEVVKYGQAVAAATTPNEKLAAALAQAEARLAAADSRFKMFANTAAKLKGDLQVAGVNTAKLSSEIDRLKTTATGATTALRNVGEKSTLAAKGFQLFSNNGRSTLSLFQRMRGEVSALAASFVGFYGAINLTAGVLDTYNKRVGTLNKLSVAVGQQNAAAEFAYVRTQADRLGVVLTDVAGNYAEIAIAAKSANLNQNQTRVIFESFAEVGRVMNLSQENIDGVYKALTQMLSKGTVQAEELRGQIGDRLAGAFYEFAESIGVSGEQLNDLLKKGQVSSQFVVNFAQQMRSKVAPQLAGATDTIAAAQARYKTALDDFKMAIADSGFLDSFAKATNQLTGFLKSADGKQFAEGLGKAMSAVAEMVVWVVKNFDSLLSTAKTLASVWASWQIAKLAASLVNAATAALSLVKNLGAARVSVGALMAMLSTGWAGIIAAGVFGIGAFLYTQSPTIRKFVDEVGGWFKEMWHDATGKSSDAAEKMRQQIAALRSEASRILLTSPDKSRAKELLAEADALEQRAKALKNYKATSGPNGRVYKVQDTGATKLEAGNLPSIGALRTSDDTKAAEDAAKKRVKLAEDVANELKRIDDTIAKAEADTLQERLALIDREYAALYAQLNTLQTSGTQAQKDAAATQSAQLDTYIEYLKRQETDKFNTEQKQKALEAITKQEQAIADLKARSTAEQELATTRATAIGQAEVLTKQQLVTIQESYNAKIREAALKTIEMIDAIKDPAVQASLATMRTEMEGLAENAAKAKKELYSTDEVANDIADGLTDTTNSLIETTVETGNLGKGFTAARDSFREFASDFLQQIALMIIKQTILNALQSSTGGNAITTGIAAIVNSSSHHAGGVVGSGGTPRAAYASWFIGAPRYHGGGVAGLKSDEVPAILQTGERVMSRAEVKASVSSQPINLQMINSVDSESVVSQGLGAPGGTRAFMNIIKANRSSIKSMLT